MTLYLSVTGILFSNTSWIIKWILDNRISFGLFCMGWGVLDGGWSLVQYYKQRIITQKDGNIISYHWLYGLFHGKRPEGKISFIKQGFLEHIPRFIRVGILFSVGLIFLFVPSV